ncbi:Unknown protein [Striga hermonthica]|uniref:Uncharacterized protein n=1 Tax=Striga hermonthica TaxID=68872 RepID=A0A9N7NCY8_STRHE|nr:Unknown protein [Striga hermonthica]
MCNLRKLWSDLVKSKNNWTGRRPREIDGGETSVFPVKCENQRDELLEILGFRPSELRFLIETTDFHHFLPYHGPNQELVHPFSFNLSLQQKEELRSDGGLLGSNPFVTIDSTSKRPILAEIQDSYPDSAALSFGIAERYARLEKILKLLGSKSIEEQGDSIDLSVLNGLTGLRLPIKDLSQHAFAASFSSLCFSDGQLLHDLIHPTRELCLNEPLLGQVPCNCISTEMSDFFSIITEISSFKNTTKSSSQTLLVPYFERRRRARVNTDASKVSATETAVLKSPYKLKEKAPQKKKTNSKSVKEREVYNNSYLHACESLLSVIVDRQQKGKNTLLSLKKSGSQLTHFLTKLSASIAGAGIAVVLSALCRVACSRVPFCSSKVLSTGLGLGLVWLSWAVNKLRITVITISKSSGKVGEKEDEMMMGDLDRNLKDIYLRVAALMAVVVLKVA